tara:strand:+ start:241 stop:414 length:174 start_codon:yes stop_codon:yes gene_type:complete
MHNASEKLAIIRLVEDSELSVRRTLVELKISRSSFYRWYRAYELIKWPQTKDGNNNE